MTQLVLASRSPQRRAILEQLGVRFSVRAGDVEELREGDPEAVAAENARRKVMAAVGAPGGVGGEAVATGTVGGDAVAAGTVGAVGGGARAVGAGAADEVLLGVDTLVATEGAIHGKPPTAEAALETLRRLSGVTHRVVSGLALVRDGELRSATAITHVTFRRLDDATLAWYVAAGEWRGRAGGYAIQGRGAALVTRVEGDYLNVVGLPVALLLDLCPDLLTLGA